MIKIVENYLYEDIDAVKKYYPNIPDDTFMELIALDPTYTGKNSLGKYGKWLLNLFNRGKITENDFEEIPDLLNQFTTYRNRIQNKDLNSYKTLDDLADILAHVVDDMSMLTPSQKTKFLKRVKSGKIKVDKSDDYDIVLDTPNFIVYVPNTHEASMKLGKGTIRSGVPHTKTLSGIITIPKMVENCILSKIRKLENGGSIQIKVEIS